MNKQVILLAAFSFAFFSGCSSKTEKQPGEEFYDADYRAKADSTYVENEKNRAMTPAQPDNQDTNSEKVGANASTNSAASEAPAVEADKPQTSSPEKTAETTPTVDKPEAKAVAVGNFEKGKTLISKSDCLACHKLDQKIVGPAYQDVAKKYEANDKNLAYLSNKIIKGGAGAWGDIPMSAHPSLSPADAKEMAKYILSLR